MRYSPEERLEIGRRIYEGEINRHDAAVLYHISSDTARKYMRLYRANYQLPVKGRGVPKAGEKLAELREDPALAERIEVYEKMTRAELILELLKTK